MILLKVTLREYSMTIMINKQEFFFRKELLIKMMNKSHSQRCLMQDYVIEMILKI